MTHALWNEEPARKIWLSKNIWFIVEVLPVDKDATFLLSTFKFNYYSVLFSNGDMLEDHQVSLRGRLGTMPCKRCFQEHYQIDPGTGFISSDSRRWYWALLTAFLSNWTILSVSKRLQFLLTVSSELRISYRLRKSPKRLVRSDSLEDMSSTLICLLINSSFERVYNI